MNTDEAIEQLKYTDGDCDCKDCKKAKEILKKSKEPEQDELMEKTKYEELYYE